MLSLECMRLSSCHHTRYIHHKVREIESNPRLLTEKTCILDSEQAEHDWRSFHFYVNVYCVYLLNMYMPQLPTLILIVFGQL